MLYIYKRSFRGLLRSRCVFLLWREIFECVDWVHNLENKTEIRVMMKKK